jgi:PAT family beta-lactamase induction signal transducer AmpG
MAALAVVIAFCSASQDIVFDAWKTDVLPAEERGAGAAISVLGYRLGMLVSGGWRCGWPTVTSAGRACTG